MKSAQEWCENDNNRRVEFVREIQADAIMAACSLSAGGRVQVTDIERLAWSVKVGKKQKRFRRPTEATPDR